jgi:hypothetical protein
LENILESGYGGDIKALEANLDLDRSLFYLKDGAGSSGSGCGIELKGERVVRGRGSRMPALLRSDRVAGNTKDWLTAFLIIVAKG